MPGADKEPCFSGFISLRRRWPSARHETSYLILLRPMVLVSFLSQGQLF